MSIEIENKVETFVLEEDTENISASTVVFTAITALKETPITWSEELEKSIMRGLTAAWSKIRGNLKYNDRVMKILETFPEVQYVCWLALSYLCKNDYMLFGWVV